MHRLRQQRGLKNQFGLSDLDAEILAFRVVPHFLAEFARKYFRLHVEGVENIPRRGPALIAPNHSGFSGFDALLLSHEVFRASGRIPRVLTHRFWFMNQFTAVPAEKAGFIEASTENGLVHLKKNNLVVIFPEGEKGNFKSTVKRYALREFKRGFVRMALLRQCPIIPTVIIGAEETHLNLGNFKLKPFNLTLPLPVNFVPLPAKWRIRFLKPVMLPYHADVIDDSELMNEIAQDIRERMQKAISQELDARGSVF